MRTRCEKEGMDAKHPWEAKPLGAGEENSGWQTCMVTSNSHAEG